MRDACLSRDLLLSLRFAGSELDCAVRRRVNEFGLRRHVRGCRAGLHSRRNTRSYVLTSIAPDFVPVITGNRPLPCPAFIVALVLDLQHLLRPRAVAHGPLHLMPGKISHDRL